MGGKSRQSGDWGRARLEVQRVQYRQLGPGPLSSPQGHITASVCAYAMSVYVWECACISVFMYSCECIYVTYIHVRIYVCVDMFVDTCSIYCIYMWVCI